MRILQRLFNTAPEPNAKGITDRRGRRYWVVWDDDEIAPNVYVLYYGDEIGQAKLFWNQSELVLGDIVFFKDEHKGSSLGTTLLQEVVTYARRHGAQAISGSISAPDAKENPKLFDWYRRNGFQVTPEKGEIWIASILMDLQEMK